MGRSSNGTTQSVAQIAEKEEEFTVDFNEYESLEKRSFMWRFEDGARDHKYSVCKIILMMT